MDSENILTQDHLPGQIEAQDFQSSHFWMRAVSFVGLRNLLRIFQEYQDGLTAKEVETLVQQQQIFTVRHAQPPSATTIYHYRNTLLHLGILVRKGRRLQINDQKSQVTRLMAALGNDNILSLDEKERFACLIIHQRDCGLFFTDLFWPEEGSDYTLSTWRAHSVPVIWKELRSTNDNRIVFLNQNKGKKSLRLTTENHIQAVLYGVRYWFRDELGLIDELFREDTGNIMFPVLPENLIERRKVISLVLSNIKPEQEWTRLSVRDLALAICVEHHIPLQTLFQTIKWLHRRYQGYISLIPTTRSFATLTASSRIRENYELRSYIQDEQGRWISHIRFHYRLKELVT